MQPELNDEVYEGHKLVPLAEPQHSPVNGGVDPGSISPTEFDSAAVGLSQLTMQLHDNPDETNVNYDIFHDLLSSGKFKRQNFAKYLMAKIILLNSRGDEAEYLEPQ